MWRVTAATILATMLGAAILSMQTTQVHACTLFIDDIIAEADLIVEGRYISYAAVNEEPLSDPATGREVQRVSERTELSLSRVLKGSTGLELVTILNTAFVDQPPSGYCFPSVASDPTGKYTITALGQAADGTYRFVYSFYLGDESVGSEYERALERLASYPAAASLPALGTGPVPSTATHHLIAGVAAGGAALLLASLSIRYMSRRPPL